MATLDRAMTAAYQVQCCHDMPRKTVSYCRGCVKYHDASYIHSVVIDTALLARGFSITKLRDIQRNTEIALNTHLSFVDVLSVACYLSLLLPEPDNLGWCYPS